MSDPKLDADFDRAMIAARPASAALKLTKLTEGAHAVYRTADGRVNVMRMAQYRNRMKQLNRKGVEVEFIAYMPALLPRVKATGDNRENEIARGLTLTVLKKNLARYYADEAAGTLGRRANYGFSGDNKPVARLEG